MKKSPTNRKDFKREKVLLENSCLDVVRREISRLKKTSVIWLMKYSSIEDARRKVISQEYRRTCLSVSMYIQGLTGICFKGKGPHWERPTKKRSHSGWPLWNRAFWKRHYWNDRKVLFATVPESSINLWDSWFIFNLRKNKHLLLHEYSLHIYTWGGISRVTCYLVIAS